MSQPFNPMTPKPSQQPFNNASQSNARDGSRQRKRESSLAPLIIIAVAFLCFSISLLAFAYYRNVNAPIIKALSGPFTYTTPTAESQASCQSLIDQAISYTGKNCDHISPNEACYGNVTIQAQMIANASQRFSERGDIADMGQIQSISAAPLNLTTDEWGIAIFKVLGNVPGTVPGQAATLMVFGNTKLDKPTAGLDSFFFSSELGQIACEKVPMDGLMITMPEGTGWTFKVNGTKLTLIGNASLTATKNGSMVIGLYKGAAAITSLGQTQYFGAGQSVSVKLGGANGTQAISPPSKPQPLSADEMAIACSTTGRYCTPDAIPTVSAADAQVMIQSGQALNPSIFGTPLPPAGSVDLGGSTGGTSGSTGGQGTGGSGSAVPTTSCSGLGNPDCNPNNTGQGGSGGGGNKP